jgi:ribosomal protein L37AE/L43A
MAEKKNFNCNYCQKAYNVDYLAAINEYPNDKTLLQKEIWEKELVRLKNQQLFTDSIVLKNQLTTQINSIIQQLRQIDLQLQTNKEYTCQTCHNKFKVKEIKTFTCDICQQEINGKMLEGHIENYQIQGISRRKWSKFCQNCRDTKIILANIYCPRTSDGRDDDWDTSLPLYDCDCPPELNENN